MGNNIILIKTPKPSLPEAHKLLFSFPFVYRFNKWDTLCELMCFLQVLGGLFGFLTPYWPTLPSMDLLLTLGKHVNKCISQNIALFLWVKVDHMDTIVALSAAAVYPVEVTLITSPCPECHHSFCWFWIQIINMHYWQISSMNEFFPPKAELG